MDTPEVVVEMLMRIEDAYTPPPPGPLGTDHTPSIS